MSGTADTRDDKGLIPAHWRRGPAIKMAAVLGLFLAMLVPQLLTSGLIREREGRQAEVLATFRSGWGPEQVVSGPILVVPYSIQPSPGSTTPTRGVLRLPASQLDVVATLDPQRRRRGLFQATVYTATVTLSGVMTIPPAPEMAGNPEIDWGAARVLIGVGDLRGVQPDQTLQWAGAPIPMQPDTIASCDGSILAAPARLSAPPAAGSTVAFKAGLTLRGTQAFRVAPEARQTTVHVTSSWSSPSFTGITLPVSVAAGSTGFDARWDIPAEPSRTGWRTQAACPSGQTVDAMNPGVELQEAVPTYAMMDRAEKYGPFFLALAYLTLFLFEALSRVRIHLVQYGLIGLSVSLFALLLISIAEPLGFAVAYALSATAVVAQASLYTLAVVGRARLAAIFAGVLGALFAFIYVVLNLDAYALLTGTVALFVGLSVLMAATRRVDWGSTQPVA